MTQLASTGGDTAADFDSGSGGESVAPQPYLLGAAEGPLDVDALRSRRLPAHRGRETPAAGLWARRPGRGGEKSTAP